MALPQDFKDALAKQSILCLQFTVALFCQNKYGECNEQNKELANKELEEYTSVGVELTLATQAKEDKQFLKAVYKVLELSLNKLKAGTECIKETNPTDLDGGTNNAG